MIQTKVLSNLAEAVQFCQYLGDQVRPEVAKALNVANRGVRTDVTRQVAKTKKIPRDKMKDWKIFNASPSSLEATAKIRGKRIGLEEFGPKPNRVMDGASNNGGVTVSIYGKQVKLRHGFMHDFRTGNLQVLQRKKGKRPKTDYDEKGRRLKGRFPVYHPTAQSVPQMADDEAVVDVVTANAGNRFLKQFDHLLFRLAEEFK